MLNALMGTAAEPRNGTRSSENLPLLMTKAHDEEENGLLYSSSSADHHSPNERVAHYLSSSQDDDDENDAALFSTTPMMTHAHFLVPSSFPNHRGSLFLPTAHRAESPVQQNHRRQRSHSWGGRPVTMDMTDWDDVDVRPSLSWLYVPSLRPATNDSIQAPISAAVSAPQMSTLEDQRLIGHPSLTMSLTDTTIEVSGSPSRRSSRKKVPPEQGNSIGICILYGIINATIVIPVILSFATIIYRDPIFAPHLHSLIQLTLFSSIIHQLVFSTCSTLPFAIGQVQDAGLIFLSNMATTIVQYYSALDNDEEVDPDRRMIGLLATTTFTLSLATALLGLSLMAIGHFRLAQYVQLLPTCVVGGYLAYIGWFCGRAGIDLMMSAIPKQSTDSNTAGDLRIRASWIVFVLPGVLGGAMIYVAIRKVQHMATLPVCILLEFILFYVVLYLTDTSLEDATDQGWIRGTANSSSSSSDIVSSQSLQWCHTWDFILRWDLIDWNVLPSLLPNLLGMIFVVALSSSLDVSAIEIELKQPLNYNHELQMIGMSNLISGCTGGYTGSYIFSQSIFSLRAGIRSRWAGFVLAFCELMIFITPIPILSYVPNFLFGSLLIMICIDLMWEWLWDVRMRFTAAEYALCLSTFGLIQWLNVEYGILSGIVLYLLSQQVGLNVGVSKFVSSPTERDNETMVVFESTKSTSERHVPLSYGATHCQ